MLVQTELMENRRVDIPEMIGALNRSQANGICGADYLAAFDTAPCHPHGETEIMMIAAFT